MYTNSNIVFLDVNHKGCFNCKILEGPTKVQLNRALRNAQQGKRKETSIFFEIALELEIVKDNEGVCYYVIVFHEAFLESMEPNPKKGKGNWILKVKTPRIGGGNSNIFTTTIAREWELITRYVEYSTRTGEGKFLSPTLEKFRDWPAEEAIRRTEYLK